MLPAGSTRGATGARASKTVHGSSRRAGSPRPGSMGPRRGKRPSHGGCSYDRWVDSRVRTAANRQMLADFFDGLDDDQLQTRSLCDAWTVREVLGHLVMPLTGSVGGFLLQVVRARGSLNRASEAVATDLSRRPVAELTALLRSHADLHGKAPGVGPMGQMADGCLHLRDCARPWVFRTTCRSPTGGWCSTGCPRVCQALSRRGMQQACTSWQTTKTGRGAMARRSMAPARRWQWRWPGEWRPSTISTGQASTCSGIA